MCSCKLLVGWWKLLKGEKIVNGIGETVGNRILLIVNYLLKILAKNNVFLSQTNYHTMKNSLCINEQKSNQHVSGNSRSSSFYSRVEADASATEKRPK